MLPCQLRGASSELLPHEAGLGALSHTLGQQTSASSVASAGGEILGISYPGLKGLEGPPCSRPALAFQEHQVFQAS